MNASIPETRMDSTVENVPIYVQFMKQEVDPRLKIDSSLEVAATPGVWLTKPPSKRQRLCRVLF